ncbi:hypothetical protein BC6307_04030 [Sutcliffiella cohnii]|uniref:Uncharacterized protein n=1 Tax=Sutcliffiella cohnii TaxID=33932 RepID=A0A223KM08_9BACI|nr:hypothetical protein BC6307_04030 [Sutcliffiella cohnii]
MKFEPGLAAGARRFQKRRALVQRRQAQGKPARRLLFDLLDGLTCDLEPLAPVARRPKAEAARLGPIKLEFFRRR